MNVNFPSAKTKLIFSILFVAFLFNACTRQVKHDSLITNVNIVDVRSGKILKNKTVAIDDGRISAIYNKERKGSDSTVVINGSDKYLIPGLWDMHAHYKWSHADLDPLLIANGITGVREMWGKMPAFVVIPESPRNEKLPSPDIYTSGDLIDGDPPSFPGSVLLVTSPAEAVAAVDKQIEEQVDFIKIYSSLSEECFKAVSEEANRKNIQFAGHIPNGVSMYKAIEAGMASSEHLYGFLNACSSENGSSVGQKSNEELLSTFSENRFDSLCNLLAKSKMWICPTLTINRALASLNDSVFTTDARMAYLPEYILGIWKQQLGVFTKDQIDSFVKSLKPRYMFELGLIGKMNSKGVKLLAGTDFPNPYSFPGFSLHDELSLMVKGGMSATDVLRTGTLNAAIFMHRENDYGTVEAGKIASLVLLKKNPLENIENTKSIEAVILRGEVFDRAALDKMLPARHSESQEK